VLTPEDLAAYDGALADAAAELHSLLQRPASWLESKISEGGTALARVKEQIDAAARVIDGLRAR
jgi:hypothetical protein